MMVNQEGSWPFRCICYLSDVSALEISDIITAPCVPFIAAAILFDNLLSLSFPVYNHHTTFSFVSCVVSEGVDTDEVDAWSGNVQKTTNQ